MDLEKSLCANLLIEGDQKDQAMLFISSPIYEGDATKTEKLEKGIGDILVSFLSDMCKEEL